MIRRPTLNELIDAATSLDVTEQVAVIVAIRDQLRKSEGEVAGLSAGGPHAASDDWMSDATWDDVMDRVYVREAVEAGRDDAAAGRLIDVEEVRRRFGLPE